MERVEDINIPSIGLDPNSNVLGPGPYFPSTLLEYPVRRNTSSERHSHLHSNLPSRLVDRLPRAIVELTAANLPKTPYAECEVCPIHEIGVDVVHKRRSRHLDRVDSIPTLPFGRAHLYPGI